jgi:hypothetical protein
MRQVIVSYLQCTVRAKTSLRVVGKRYWRGSTPRRPEKAVRVVLQHPMAMALCKSSVLRSSHAVCSFFGWLALARVTGPVGAASVTQAQRR